MPLSVIKNSFSAGEISPSIFGRTDLNKYHLGAFTMRNFFVNYRGGASSRAGYAYVGTCKQLASVNSYPPRLIPFQFNINQGYALEFGDQYMRVISDGAYILEATKNITAATNANPLVITSVAHGYLNGDWVYILGMGGMTELNGLTWIVTNKTNDTYQLTDMFGNVVDSSVYGVYTSGGTSARVYTVVAPYAAADLPYLKFTQSADTMSLTCVNQETLTEYPPYDLIRNGITNWVFTQTVFTSSISAPSGITVVAHSSTTPSTYYSYVVTAVDSVTGDESISSTVGSVQNNDISVNAGSNSITWNSVVGAKSYNVYKAVPSYAVTVPLGASFGYMGTAFATSFTDTNIIADFTKVPPIHNDPFARGAITDVTVTAGGSGYTQSGIGYTVTTSTGSGFVGSPIVIGDALVAFLIINKGANYASGDTIAITGGATTASGHITFSANPANNDTITLNGVAWTFTSGAPGAAKTVIQGTLTATLAQLVSDVTASVSGSLTVASYSSSPTVFTITYGTSGAGGNSYTLASAQANAVVSGATLTGGGSGGGATATLTVGPQTGTYPGVVAYFQQRRGYANTTNEPDTYFFSHPGAFKNMDISIPSTDSDAVIGAPWAQQINGIQAMQPMPSGLIILTGNGAWLLTGGNQVTLTPSSQTATSEAFTGCHTHVTPIVVNYDILYVQSQGSIIRDLAYNFFVNVYTGTDTTTISSHLFNYHQITQWAYAEEPFKVIWCIRDDGIMLSFTYLKEQDVGAYARHDTNGFFVSVTAVTEPPVNAVYTIVKRFINGQWKYYTERADNRNWRNVEDVYCVDSGLSYTGTLPNATLSPALADGTSNISSVNLVYGGFGYTAPSVTVVDPNGAGSGATFSTTLSAGVITAISVLTEGSNYTMGSTLQISDMTGSGAVAYPVITNIVDFTTSGSVFSSGNVGDVIRIGNNNATVGTEGITPNGGGRAVITSYISGTHVKADVLEAITAVIPDNSTNTPAPVILGQWSLSTPVRRVHGLNHLEGETVSILADGSVLPSQTVINGAVSFPAAYSQITIGLPFICQLQTPYLDPQGGNGTVQGKRKNIGSVIVRTDASRGFSVGTNQIDQSTTPDNATPVWDSSTGMTEVKERNAVIHAGTAIPLFTGDSYVNVEGGWDTRGQVAIQTTYPLPLNVTACIINYTVGDTLSE